MAGIPRCEHGVYSVAGEGKPSEYCSGCTTPTLRLLLVVEEEENVVQQCPVCWMPITVLDEYDFECDNCGFNGINDL
jgi:hypothetical protein